VYNHCNTCNIPIYFYNIYLKHLQYTFETSKTLETYACNMRFQQNLAARREHCTARSGYAVAVGKEDDSGWAAAWPLVSGCAAPGDRAHAVPPASGARGGGSNNRQRLRAR